MLSIPYKIQNILPISIQSAATGIDCLMMSTFGWSISVKQATETLLRRGQRACLSYMWKDFDTKWNGVIHKLTALHLPTDQMEITIPYFHWQTFPTFSLQATFNQCG